MKIAYFVPIYGLASETFVTDLVEGLLELGVELLVVAGEVIGPAPAFVEQIPLFGRPPLARRVMARLAYREAMFETWESGQTRLRARRLLTQFLKGREIDAAYVEFGTMAVVVQSALTDARIPFVIHFHGADITTRLNSEDYRQELHICFDRAAALICPSQHLRRLLVLEGAQGSLIHAIPHGVRSKELKASDWAERRKGPPGVVALGRLTPKKHPIALAEAFARVLEAVPETQCTIIGDGPVKEALEKRLDRLGLRKRVRLLGELSRKEALGIVDRHWIFAQHSVTSPAGDQESFAISLLEAAALALPVVSTFHNGIPEHVADGKTGYLVQEHDFEAMAGHLIRLARDPQLCESMGARGRERALSCFPMEARCRAIRDLLERVARDKR